MWETIVAKIGWALLWGKLKSIFGGGKKVKITERRVELPGIKYSERITEVPLSKETMTLVDGGVETILTSPVTAEPMSKALTQAGAKELEKAKVRMEKIKQRQDAERLVEAPRVKALPDKEKLLFSIFAFIAYGDKSFHSDAFSEAEKAYREAYEFAQKLDDKPLESICLNLIGAAVGSRGKPEAVLPLFDEALRLNPDYALAWNNKGVTLDHLKRHEEAIACYNEVIRLKPDYADAWNNKGVALDNLKRHEEAIACYDEAIRLNPDYADAWNNKGVALDHLKRYEEAIACYDEAIRLKPDYADAWNNKGVALDHLKRYEEAIPCYNEAIRLKPDYADAWYNKGVAFRYLERYEEAIPCFDEALKLNPNYGRAWAMKGRVVFQLEQRKEAKESFVKALPLRDQHPDKGMLVFGNLTFLILIEGLENVASKDMKGAEERALELAQLRKEAEKDDMARVVDEAIAKSKEGLSKRDLKRFLEFEAILAKLLR